MVGGLALAEFFFEAHPEGESLPVLLSEMLQVGRGVRLAALGAPRGGGAEEVLSREGHQRDGQGSGPRGRRGC